MSFFDDLISKLKSGQLATVSALKLRSESAQQKIKLKRIEKLKREEKKRSKLLFALEIAVPFNPFTGEEDDQYNVDNKYRPLMSATTSAILLKKLAAGNEKVKQSFMDRAGVETWDLSAPEVLTEEDKK